MSYIKNLSISNFRNLKLIDFNPSENFNIIYGKNGAGKTSLLEALYYLGHGRSFRSNQTIPLIRKTCTRFSLHLKLATNNTLLLIGLEKEIDGKRRIRYNNENIHSIAPLAKSLPIQLISSFSYRFFDIGPKIRRQFMNWGLFHVEPSFFSVWQRLLHTLKQRNAALKAGLPYKEIIAWDQELISSSTQIDELRKNYLTHLNPILHELLPSLFKHSSLLLSYKRGWPEHQTYADALKKSLKKDLILGYTSIGPQRADLQLTLDDQPAELFLSRGQQKLATYALYIAQGILLQRYTKKTPIYLIDDFPSELDPEKREQIVIILKDLQAQVFITGITQSSLSETISLSHSQWFHVEQGELTRVGANLNSVDL